MNNTNNYRRSLPPPPPSEQDIFCGNQSQNYERDGPCINNTSFIPLRPKVSIGSPGDEAFCDVTRKEREADAMSKVDNRIFFLGLTALGYQKPMREAVNPQYRDAYEGRPQLDQFLPDRNSGKEIDHERLAENFRSMDVYSGLVDGKNYGRYNRLYRHKLRNARHPYGPEERFCVPITNNMNIGWWVRDKKCLDERKWWAPDQRFPQVRGEITKFVDEMANHTPNFILF